MPTYQTPGVYIREIETPGSIYSLPTAVPVFIGYTQKAAKEMPGDLLQVAHRVHSLAEYEQYYGLAFAETGIQVTLYTDDPALDTATQDTHSPYQLYYGLQLYFANGGGPCYILSVGEYSNGSIQTTDLLSGLTIAATVKDITLLIFPDALSIAGVNDYYLLYKTALQQCAELQNRFTVLDVWTGNDDTIDAVDLLRRADLGSHELLRYGAAYYPQLLTDIPYRYNETAIAVTINNHGVQQTTLAALAQSDPIAYDLARLAIGRLPTVISGASCIAAAVYVSTDNSRDVWTAPANTALTRILKPVISISNHEQSDLNVHPTGRSVNAIRLFTGRGTLIWGARTLDGNDNEWRYISVVRTCMMIRESVQFYTRQMVFEPNDAATWVKLKGMIENYLVTIWRAGGLMGNKPADAFSVAVGLGTTMTATDMLEGKMIVQLALALTRPAEFIMLQFAYTMQAA